MNSTSRNDYPTPGTQPGSTQSREHWESVYDTCSEDEVSWFQPEPEQSLKLIEHAGLAVGDPIIDVGGGASVLVDRLLEKGFGDLTVLDISPASMESSRKRMGQAAKQVEWIQDDVRRYEPKRQFALWHDRALFHFMTREADRRSYTEALQNAVSAGGHVIIAAFAIGGPRRCSGLDIIRYDAAKLANELGPGFHLEEQVQETHITPSRARQLFGYYLFRRT